jgi:hypothetical protein
MIKINRAVLKNFKIKFKISDLLFNSFINVTEAVKLILTEII